MIHQKASGLHNEIKLYQTCSTSQLTTGIFFTTGITVETTLGIITNSIYCTLKNTLSI